MAKNEMQYVENGVTISKSKIYVGDEVTLTYSGLLARSGADQIFAYVGYGDEWEEKGFIPMSKAGDVFLATFKVTLSGKLNIDFKDSANNWDNNSGNNYVFQVVKKATKAPKPDETEKVEPKAVVKERVAVVPEVEAPKKAKSTRKKKEE